VWPHIWNISLKTWPGKFYFLSLHLSSSCETNFNSLKLCLGVGIVEFVHVCSCLFFLMVCFTSPALFFCSYGSFFGPSQPVISQRVIQESKSILENQHLALRVPNAQHTVCIINFLFFPNHVRNACSRLSFYKAFLYMHSCRALLHWFKICEIIGA
jgi:hypothetical protein